MKIVIKTKNLELTQPIYDYVNQKIGALERYIKKVVEAQVDLERRPAQQTGPIYRAEAMIFVPNKVIRAEEEAAGVTEAIDLLVPKLKKQIESYRGKYLDKDKRAGGIRDEKLP